MRKLQSYMIALFCTGVFAAGLGTGITFSEFSSFAYMGDADAGPVDMKTEILDYDMGQSHHSDETSDPDPRRTPVWILSGQTVCLNQKRILWLTTPFPAA